MTKQWAFCLVLWSIMTQRGNYFVILLSLTVYIYPLLYSWKGGMNHSNFPWTPENYIHNEYYSCQVVPCHFLHGVVNFYNEDQRLNSYSTGSFYEIDASLGVKLTLHSTPCYISMDACINPFHFSKLLFSSLRFQALIAISEIRKKLI